MPKLSTSSVTDGRHVRMNNTLIEGRSHTTVQHERTSYAHRKVGKSECVSYASLCVSHPESLRYMCVMCVTCTPMYGYVRWLLRTF